MWDARMVQEKASNWWERRMAAVKEKLKEEHNQQSCIQVTDRCSNNLGNRLTHYCKVLIYHRLHKVIIVDYL